MCTTSVSNVIYHKFSHDAAFYTLNEKNIHVMLEYMIITINDTPLQLHVFWPSDTERHNKSTFSESVSLSMKRGLITQETSTVPM